MSAPKAKYRFESEVHLGLLSIILVLVMMSLVSNFVLFKARVRLQENTANALRSAALTVSRNVQVNGLSMMSTPQGETLGHQLGLTSLLVLPEPPAENTPEAKARWLASILSETSPGQIPDVADQALSADLKKLTRGKNNQFYMATPLHAGTQSKLLVISMINPDLGYLQDASRVILWVGFGASLAVSLVYFILSRSIFMPFRRIKEAAQRAGRPVAATEHEADLVVAEYRQVIEDLREKEAELLRLNAAIRSRADSLEQFNQLLLSSIDSGIITTDETCRITSANEAAKKMLHCGSANLVGQPLEKVFTKDSWVEQQVRLALKGLPFTGYNELSSDLPDGSSALLGVSVSAVRDAGQSIIGASTLLNDLTEVTLLRQQVEQKNRLEALGEMAAGLAHQLRNSVGAISGFGNLIKRRLNKAEQQTDMVESLLKEAKEAEDLIGKFLAFARPLKLQLERIGLDTVIREIVEGFNAQDRSKEITCRVDVPRGTHVWADVVLLKQALTNLLDNAAHAYDGREGRIEISAKVANGTTTVLIQDFGCGIPADRLDKIFTPFYSSRPSGTGLGLPFTSRVVDLHGGRLMVDSHEGRGTTVSIILPLEPSFQTA